jgi:signal peptide peptidase SppA
MFLDLNDPLWYGTEASFYEAVALERRFEAQAQMSAGPFDDVPEDYLLQKQGNIGLINIAGPLINADHPILAFFGVATYPAIRRAVVSAAKDAAIDHIVLAVDSGGGAVNGVVDTAELIARVNAKVKPVTTMAHGTMASAAYWLGASAEKVHASKTSITGSIGVLMVHLDRTKQLEDAGIKPTVLRAGKYKALLNPFEKPTDAALEQQQAQLDAAYRLFVQHVADARGVDYDQADRKMAQGREFFGAAAVDAGLIDSITTLDAVLSALAERKGVDKRRASYDNVIKGKSMKTAAATLTEQDIAAIAAGASLEAQPGEAVVAAPAAAAAAPVAEAAPAAAAAVAPTDGAGETAGAGVVAPTAEVKEDGAGVVKYLQAQVKEKDESIVSLRIELKDANEKLEAAQATHDPMLGIVRASIKNMRVALGSPAGDVDGLKATEALAEHARLLGEFKKAFKAGGVAAAAPATDKQETAAAPALRQARIAAAKL